MLQTNSTVRHFRIQPGFIRSPGILRCVAGIFLRTFPDNASVPSCLTLENGTDTFS